MDFHQFKYVMAIAEEKSFSKAAQKLFISQPSLSQYIMRLEQQLGTKLFDRTTNPLRLTYAGEKYIEASKNILNLANQLEEQLGDIAGSSKGCIKIGISFPTERYILPSVLPEFYKRYPNVEIAIEEYSAIELEKMLIAGEVDFAIIHLPIQNKKIVYESLSDEKIFLVAPPKYQPEKGRKLDFRCLRNEKFILSKPGHRMRAVADEIFTRAEFKPDVIFEIRNLDAIYRFAAAGMGFAFVPENVISLLNTNQYKNCFLIDDIVFTLAIAYRQGQYMTKAACEFIGITKKIVDSKHKLGINHIEIHHNISVLNSNI